MILIDIYLIIISFLSGSIMYSYLLPKLLRNIDIRELSDDKNPGSGNVVKHCGVPLGSICIFLDVFKAFLPVYISIVYFNVNGIFLVLIAIAPIIGHAYSPFLKFNGGKAIASTFGSFLALYNLSNIALTFALILIFFKFILTINPNSSVILISIFLLDTLTFTFNNNFYIKLIVLIISIVIFHKHKINRNDGDITISLFNRYFKKTLFYNRKN